LAFSAGAPNCSRVLFDMAWQRAQVILPLAVERDVANFIWILRKYQ
jgi:hypothetical protein